MRQPERSVSHFSGFFTENRPEKAFLRGQFSLSLRSDLTHQNIGSVYLRTDTDDTFFIQISQRVLAYVRNISRDLFRSQLRISGLGFVLFDMNRRQGVVHEKSFV